MGVAWKGQLLQQLLVRETSEGDLHSLAILISEQMLGSLSQRPVWVLSAKVCGKAEFKVHSEPAHSTVLCTFAVLKEAFYFLCWPLSGVTIPLLNSHHLWVRLREVRAYHPPHLNTQSTHLTAFLCQNKDTPHSAKHS